MVSGGVRVGRLQYRDAELGASVEFDYSLLDGRTRFPFRLQFEQYKLLELLRRTCDDDGIDVRYGVTAVGIDGTGTSSPAVVVQSGDAAETETLRADLVVGADGAHSMVRKALGLDFAGTTYDNPNAVLATDVDLRTVADSLGPVSYWTSPHGKISFIRTPDHWRIGLTTPAGLEGADPAGWGRELLSRVFGLPADMPLTQAATFRIHQRLAASMAVGRVALVGDAAHLNSPTGGLGLNSGIHDAFDLVARVTTSGTGNGGGDSAGEVLGGYSAIRSAVAREVVQKVSARNTAMSSGKDRSSREELITRLRCLADDRAAATEYLLEVSMLAASRSYPAGTVSISA